MNNKHSVDWRLIVLILIAIVVFTIGLIPIIKGDVKFSEIKEEDTMLKALLEERGSDIERGEP